jgi:hypothetical protein
VRILRVFERNTSDVRIFFTTNQFCRYYHVRSKRPPPDVELKFQMQAMTKMTERMNFVMGNLCDRLEKMGKHGNVAGICTQDVRKVGAELKLNNGSEAERPRWF